VQDFAAHPVQEEVGGVAVAEAENVSDHGHDGQRPSEVRPPVEPDL
jgi:hypothetical protein